MSAQTLPNRPDRVPYDSVEFLGWLDDVVNIINNLPITEYGTYTPTLTNGTNVAGSTSYTWTYMKVGDSVIAGGRIDVDPTAAAPTSTVLGISIPIASNFGAVGDCSGTMASTNTQGEVSPVRANVANDRAEMAWNTIDSAVHDMYGSFIYRII